MAARFWVGGSGTWDASDTTHWSTSTGGAGGASVPGASDTVIFDGSSGGGTVTVNTNPTLSTTVPALTMGAFTGTLDFATNNNNISLGGVSVTGTSARTLNMGSGTWTLTGVTGTVWDAGSTSNFTFNCNTSTVLLSATATGTRSFSCGNNGKVFNHVTVTNASRSVFLIDFANASGPTFNNLTLTNVLSVRFLGGSTHTINGTFTYSGDHTNQALLFTNGTAATVSVANSNSLDYVAVQNITKAGAGSISVTNGFDCGGNTGISISGPSAGGVVGVISG